MELNSYLELASNLNVLEITKDFLSDKRFFVWSGSSKPTQHHYGRNGLNIHTYQVIKLCLTTNETLGNPVNPSHLFLAALFHDYGKIYDYEPIDDISLEPYTNWKSTSHRYKIHHISRSFLHWNKLAEKYKISQDVIDEVGHAILAHHGQRLWGSPVEPKTQLAWILHGCDLLSARVDDCKLAFQ